MSANDFQHIKARFHALLDLDSSLREASLNQLLITEPSVGREVQRWLDAFDDNDLRAEADRIDPLLGIRLGAFVLTRRLGAGGMGVVYLGERDDGEVVQCVAIKLPGRLALLAMADTRIARERQLLASVSHPNVARLIDAGHSAQLGPWFAMEYVEGESIIHHADHARLDTSERIDLWLQVTDAVAHAHSHAIIHRDLKPANVLVDSHGNAKLLDFGIAKLIEEVAVDPAVTSVAFTARYASPEQIKGGFATTSTDVHGLGVLLYELLCGAPPFLDSGDLSLRQSIVTREPPSLRNALGQLADDEALRRAEARRVSVQHMRRSVDADIEAILAKALRKQPVERYASVTELAADVRRYRRGAPVIARRATLRYRVGSFVRRHRALTAGAAIAVLGLVAGLGVALQQRAEALQAGERASVQNQLLVGLFSAADPYNLRGSSLTVSEMLAAASNRTIAQEGLDPSLRAGLLDAIGHALFTLGRSQEADDALANAQASLVNADNAPQELKSRIALRQIAAGYELDRKEQALPALDDLWPQLQVGSLDLRIEALESRTHIRRAQGELSAALIDVEAALALCNPDCGAGSNGRLSLRLKRMDLLSELKQRDAALAEADAIWSEVSGLPESFDGIRVWVGRQRADVLTSAGRGAEAEKLLVDLAPRAERAYGSISNRQASMHASIEYAQRRRGHLRAAAESAARSAQIYAATLPGTIYEAFAHKVAGDNLRGLGDFDKAAEAFGRALVIYQRIDDAQSRSQALWCEMQIAFARYQSAPGAARRAAVEAAASRHLAVAGDDEAYRSSAIAVLAEVALTSGDTIAAHRHIDALSTRIAPGDDTSSQFGLGIYRVQLAQLEGRDGRSERDAVESIVRAIGDDALKRAEWTSLVASEAAAGQSDVACQQVRAAWLEVDPLQVALERQLSKLPHCR